jgi:hypothetical protein
MGLASKVKYNLEENTTSNKGHELSNAEIDFVLAKLRTAEYKGNEFEVFYNVWVKLTDLKSK